MNIRCREPHPDAVETVVALFRWLARGLLRICGSSGSAGPNDAVPPAIPTESAAPPPDEARHRDWWGGP